MLDDEGKTTLAESPRDGEILKLLCRWCTRSTNHEVIQSLRDDWENDYLQGRDDYLIVRCRGCDVLSFCKQSSDSETYEDTIDSEGKQSTEYTITTEQFPRVNIHFKKNGPYFSMPAELRTAYEETYGALANKMPKLAGAGLRLLIELICSAHEIETGTLQSKINSLKEKGVVTASMQQLLHNVRVFGNKNIHTKKTPTYLELLGAWDAVNTLLDAIYGTTDSNQRYSARF